MINQEIELYKTYPNVKEAVFCLESIFANNLELPSIMHDGITSGRRTIHGPNGLLEFIQSLWEERLVNYEHDQAICDLTIKAITQLEHPEFHTYLNGRLGLV